MTEVQMEEAAKEVIGSRDYKKMISIGSHPVPGEYVISGPQAGNAHGQMGWCSYIGYVVQVRKKAGEFGSDIVLIRHPTGELGRHENQCFFRMDAETEARVREIFPADISPEKCEDYSKPYTLGKEFPEIGRIIEAKESGTPPVRNRPMMQITVTDQDGNRSVEIV